MKICEWNENEHFLVTLSEDQACERIKEVPINEIGFNSIFSPLFEDSECEIISDGVYKAYFKFRVVDLNNKTVSCEGLNLYIAKKIRKKS